MERKEKATRRKKEHAKNYSYFTQVKLVVKRRKVSDEQAVPVPNLRRSTDYLGQFASVIKLEKCSTARRGGARRERNGNNCEVMKGKAILRYKYNGVRIKSVT